jgi:hypothetical protein
MAGAVLQVVHIAAKLVQAAHRLGSGSTGPVTAEQCLEQAQLVLAGEGAQRCSVVWPMPRLGVVMARRKAGSSSLLTHRRNQAHRSLISARSKKLCPPDTLYGIAPCAAPARTRGPGGWRGTARQSPELLLCAAADSCPRGDWMRATVRSASCSSLSASTTRTGSPSPSSLNRSWETAWGWGRSRCWPRAGWRWWSGSSAPA